MQDNSAVREFLGYAPANLFVPVLLFILLSPGLIITFPAKKDEFSARWFSGETNMTAVFVHALLFLIVLYFLRRFFASSY